MSVPISQCTVFVQIWVDTNSAQAGKTTGIYLVDNRVSTGSANEGSASLQTSCTLNSYVCWQISAIDPNFTKAGGAISIQQIGNCNAWGASGQPQAAPGTVPAFTGQVQHPGTSGYSINLTLQSPGGSGITLTVNPSIAVAAATLAEGV